MPLLTTKEAFQATDAFLWTLYGDELFLTWSNMKKDMNFSTEREYVSWLMELAFQEKERTNNEMAEENLQVDNNPQSIKQETAVVEMAGESDIRGDVVSRVYHGSSNRQQLAIMPSTSAAYQGNQPHVGLLDDDSIKHEAGLEAAAHEVAAEVYEDDDEKYYVGDDGTDPQSHDESLLSSDNDTSNMDALHSDSLLAVSYDMTGDDGSGMMTAGCSTSTANSKRGHQQLSDYPLTTSYDRDGTSQPLLSSANDDGDISRHSSTALAIDSPHAVGSVNVGSVGSVGGGGQVFYCPHCNHCSQQKSNLKSHLILKHGYPSKHSCHACGKGFHSRGRLNMHHTRCKRLNNNGSQNTWTQ